MNTQACIRTSSDEGSPGTFVLEHPAPPPPRRILVADDNEAIRHLLDLVLTRCGFEVKAVCDGQQAWEALALEHYDLLITDNDMPNLTGEELVSRTRAAGMTLPVIVASGTFASGKPGGQLRPPIAAVLPKPFGIIEVLNTVRRALPARCAEDFTVRGIRPAALTQPNTLPIMQTVPVSSENLLEFTPRVESRPAPAPPAARNCGWSASMTGFAPLPVETFEEDASSAVVPLPVPTTPASEALDHKRILIVDDDALVRGSLAAVLESEGFVVEEAHNGREAVTRSMEQPPDLVLLDLNMPHWDGWTAFSQIDRLTPLLPVIVITARPNQYEKAVRLGVDAFMEKPLNISLLVRAVKRLTREDEGRHLRRITDPGFVTRLLGGTGS